MVLSGSDVTLTCSVQMGENILSAHLESLMMVNASITKPDGTVVVLSNPEIEGTAYKLTTRVISFGDDDVGNYTCNATVKPSPSAVYLTGMGQLVSSPFQIVIGNADNTDMNSHTDSFPYSIYLILPLDIPQFRSIQVAGLIVVAAIQGPLQEV